MSFQECMEDAILQSVMEQSLAEVEVVESEPLDDDGRLYCKQFHIGQGVAQSCSILFSIFINQFLEKAGFGINDVKVAWGLMFADDFVGLTTNAEDLLKLIDVVQEFCNKWRLKSNIKKSAVMVFSKEVVKGTCTWKWGV